MRPAPLFASARHILTCRGREAVAHARTLLCVDTRGLLPWLAASTTKYQANEWSPHIALFAAVYDVTRRETLSSLSGSWMQELQMYDPHPEVARMVVANKVDQVRPVTVERGRRRGGGTELRCARDLCCTGARCAHSLPHSGKQGGPGKEGCMWWWEKGRGGVATVPCR